MINREIYDEVACKFSQHYGRPHSVAAYAPGRVEVLGNHTDYNEGFVLSAAINFGTFFLAAPSNDTTCWLVAGDIMEEATFDATSPTPSVDNVWSNYVKGVFAKLSEHGGIKSGFLGMFLGNIPLGAGLSSSAALEMASGLALCSLYNIELEKIELAKIGQAAEHEYVGAKCGLLDQISSLFGKENELVMSDFRSLQVQNIPLPPSSRSLAESGLRRTRGKDALGAAASAKAACFLMCNTSVKHSLVDSEYNERRERCEAAADFFSSVLDHPVSALRDVSWEELEHHSSRMDPVTARRAAHVIGENTRVLKGKSLLIDGKLKEFGKLMFESHKSSEKNFENSCRELDFLVDTSRNIPEVLGARLSGGGFGGSAVVLVHPHDVEAVNKVLATSYEKEFGYPCDIRVVTPSSAAQVIS